MGGYIIGVFEQLLVRLQVIPLNIGSYLNTYVGDSYHFTWTGKYVYPPKVSAILLAD